MGNLCGSCCGSSYEDLTPDADTRRRQQAEAAEKRLAQQENRGIKNIDSVRRQQELSRRRDEVETEFGNVNQPNTLRWQVT